MPPSDSEGAWSDQLRLVQNRDSSLEALRPLLESKIGMIFILLVQVKGPNVSWAFVSFSCGRFYTLIAKKRPDKSHCSHLLTCSAFIIFSQHRHKQLRAKLNAEGGEIDVSFFGQAACKGVTLKKGFQTRSHVLYSALLSFRPWI